MARFRSVQDLEMSMSLLKLASELDETAQQSATMLQGIASAIELLSGPAGGERRHDAVGLIIHALQGQDRIEQRCRNLAEAVRTMARLTAAGSAASYDRIWSGLALDELRVPALHSVASTHASTGEVELF
jgi:hypothetical protein